MEVSQQESAETAGIMRQGSFVRSRKRFKAYTWKYKKTISPIGSFVLIVSQMIGFGMSDIPSVIREGGWLPALFANLLTSVLAALCSLMLLRAMTLIPHNDNFDQRIEYNTLVKYYLSDSNFRLVALLHHMGTLCSIVCGILAFSKLVDMLLLQIVGWTLALQVYPSISFGRADIVTVSAIYESNLIPEAGRNSLTLAITLGYVICAALCLRLSAYALEETMDFHVFTFIAMIGCCVQFAIFGFTRCLKDTATLRPPKVGALRFSSVIMTFVDNFSVASTTPSWANEMTKDVKVVRTMWTSTLFTSAMYHVVGYIMCVAFPTNSGSIVSDILFSKTSVLNQTAICLFVAVCVVPDVVFGGISTKYNLLNLGYCGAKSAYFWGCVLPFMFSWLLSNESYFLEYLGHIGLISALFCDFVIPVVVYKVASQGFSGLAELSPDYSMADRGLSGASDKGTSGNAKGGDSAEEAMVRRGTSIWFSKLGTLGRAITVDFLRKSTFDGTVNEETAGATSKASSSMSSTLEAVTEEEAEDLDYLQFKIIRPPPAPREEDHLYNVLRTSRRTRHACFDPLDMPDSGDEACDISTSSPLKRTPRSQRVEVFPIDFLEKRSALSAHVMLVAIGLIVVLPALFYAKS